MLKRSASGAGDGQFAPEAPRAADPFALAKRDLKKKLPRRFFQEAKAAARDGTLVLLLDGRLAKTPAGNPMALPALGLAEAMAEEWAAQSEWLDWSAMPLTRIVHSAIDRVALVPGATATDIAKYAATDLVCYRAAEPRKLVEAQAAAWDPVLAFARKKLGAVFVCTEGVMFVEQLPAARMAVEEAVVRIADSGAAAPFALAALHLMTTLIGSVLIALAAADGALLPEDTWRAAHVDEDFEIVAWGEDPEAAARRERQWREFAAAANLLKAVKASGSVW
jgi:chaperone required for assembly of F1-ATPase